MAPIIRLKAPTATWAVAISADLPVQIVAAPNATWERINKFHTRESFVKGCFQPNRFFVEAVAQRTAVRISIAVIRWIICRPTWNAVMGLTAVTSIRC